MIHYQIRELLEKMEARETFLLESRPCLPSSRELSLSKEIVQNYSIPKGERPSVYRELGNILLRRAGIDTEEWTVEVVKTEDALHELKGRAIHGGITTYKTEETLLIESQLEEYGDETAIHLDLINGEVSALMMSLGKKDMVSIMGSSAPVFFSGWPDSHKPQRYSNTILILPSWLLRGSFGTVLKLHRGKVENSDISQEKMLSMVLWANSALSLSDTLVEELLSASEVLSGTLGRNGVKVSWSGLGTPVIKAEIGREAQLRLIETGIITSNEGHSFLTLDPSWMLMEGYRLTSMTFLSGVIASAVQGKDSVEPMLDALRQSRGLF